MEIQLPLCTSAPYGPRYICGIGQAKEMLDRCENRSWLRYR